MGRDCRIVPEISSRVDIAPPPTSQPPYCRRILRSSGPTFQHHPVEEEINVPFWRLCGGRFGDGVSFVDGSSIFDKSSENVVVRAYHTHNGLAWRDKSRDETRLESDASKFSFTKQTNQISIYCLGVLLHLYYANSGPSNTCLLLVNPRR